MNAMLSEILFDASYLFIIIGTFIALILGLALIFAPSFALKFNNKVNTRFSMREKTKRIETPIRSEPIFYKYSKLSGTILTVGALFVLYTLATFNAYTLIPHLPKSLPPVIWEWIIESAQVFFYLTCSFILVFGILVFIRPSLIKGLEKAANHWISTRQGFSKMTQDINFTNKLVNAYPRVFGVSITFFSIIILFLLLPEFY